MAQVPLSEDEVINAEETARLLEMDVLKVRRLAKQGRIPAFRIPGGRKYKFFRSEVVAYATSVAAEAAAKAAAKEEAAKAVAEVAVPAVAAPEDAPVAVPAADAALHGAPTAVIAPDEAPVAVPAADETAG